MADRNGYDEYDDEEVTVTLTLDDDSELLCRVICTFPEDDPKYIALLPVEGPDSEKGEVYLYRYIVNEDGEPDLENIVDDEEFERASDAFDEYLDSAEFDELVDPEDGDQ
ncbi:MAG: DUF1292 domain-containing protein [Lachnospiraceae bacterium]|nr:DUF1292 domain-containing protein [Lachnospiraceae bacterium]